MLVPLFNQTLLYNKYYELKPKVLNKNTTVILSYIRELNGVPSIK